MNSDNKTRTDRGASGYTGHVLDRDAEIEKTSHCLPHWMQDGAITFVTMRLADSLPKEVIERWDRERLEILQRKAVTTTDWRSGRRKLCEKDRRDFDKQFDRAKHDELDKCHGRCQLRVPDVAQIVSDSLLHFDDDRYRMGDFVVMPNHVHFLVVFPDAKLLTKQCYSWMHYTATQINRLFGDKGSLWQDEAFDHLVRSEKQLEYLREYVANNPGNANLKPGEFLYRKSNLCF